VTDTELLFAPVTELAEALRRRDVSSVELTQAYLDRLAHLGPALGALAHLTRTQALAQAREADKLLDQESRGGRQRGPLLGIPYGAKDLFATVGTPTEWGSPAHVGQAFDDTATVLRRLEDAGAVLVGKLSMVELAGGPSYRYASASVTGPGRTPWNIDHWSGGSSSGPGAATAAGLVSFSLGSETWGSIVCPSSFCGVSGLRPTFGRVSRGGAMALSWTMDKVGPMARSAEDCGLILEAIAGQDPRDTATSGASGFKYPFKRGKSKSIKGMKLGVIRPDYGHGPTAQPEVGRVFDKALAVLEAQGVILVDAKMPEIPTDAAANLIVKVEAAAAFEDLTRDQARLSKLADDEQQAGLLAGLVIPAVDYLRAQRLRTLALRACGDLFPTYDALVAPGYSQVAPPITANLDEYFVASDQGLSGFGNLTGLPALCIPMGFGKAHLPLGLQFVGPAYDEATLLALGIAFQNETDWHLQRPPAPFGV
jgi:aspartyl-tRNA(Asn)/glutamyl-tRNA(Gln) amidotransferase subunit A